MKSLSARLILIIFIVSLLFSGCAKSSVEKKPESKKNAKQTTQTTTGSAENTPKEEPLVKELIFEPNPVKPESALTIVVRTKDTTLQSVAVKLEGVGGPASQEPLNGYWRNTDTISLHKTSGNEWSVGCVAPATFGIYKAIVEVEGEKFSNDTWFLKVYPEGFLAELGYKTPEEAVKARFSRDFKGCTLKEIKERELLQEDRRDRQFHKLYMVTFYKPYSGPVLPKGNHIYFYYVLKDGPQGDWRVFQAGTGP